MYKFKEGDVVCLKSGGAPMTIDGYTPDGRESCIWFEGTVRRSGIFSEVILIKFEEDGVDHTIS